MKIMVLFLLLQVGDHIIEINGINTKNITHTEAIEIIHSGGSCVRLLIRRGTRVPHLPSEGNFHGGYHLEAQ